MFCHRPGQSPAGVPEGRTRGPAAQHQLALPGESVQWRSARFWSSCERLGSGSEVREGVCIPAGSALVQQLLRGWAYVTCVDSIKDDSALLRGPMIGSDLGQPHVHSRSGYIQLHFSNNGTRSPHPGRFRHRCLLCWVTQARPASRPRRDHFQAVYVCATIGCNPIVILIRPSLGKSRVRLHLKMIRSSPHTGPPMTP